MSQQSPSARRNRKLEVSYLLNNSSPEEKPSNSNAQDTGNRETRGNAKTCDKCGHKFVQNADLRKHVSTVHENRRPFCCDICGKRFGEKGNLQKHRKSVHFNERPFQCQVCNASFAFRDGLTRHVKLVHENKRPFVCKVCTMSFKQVSQLRRHAAECTKSQ